MSGKLNWRSIRSEILFFLVFFALFMVFRTTAYGMYHIPSESMLPTLAVGDRVVVSKYSYGYSRHSVPFSIGPDIDTASGRVLGRLPERGDVVVFKHPRTNETLIKRTVGLPGDMVAVIDGRLFINDELVSRHLEDTFRYREHRGQVAHVGQFEEILPDGDTHQIFERSDRYPGDNFGPVQVPDNNIFVMGDNRDNSLDSRFSDIGVGFVPAEYLVGRANVMAFSLNHQKREPGLVRHKRNWFSKL